MMVTAAPSSKNVSKPPLPANEPTKKTMNPYPEDLLFILLIR